MSVQQGMDTARIREIAEQLRSQREKIEGVRQSGSTSAKVLRDSWAGADLSGFTERWDGPVVKQLMDAATQIGAAADLMVQQATDQDDTSSLGGGSGPGAGGPGGGPGGQGPGGGGDGSQPGDMKGTWSPFDRDQDSPFIRTNKDEDGNLHHYDPLTGKRWVEDAEGRWTNETDGRGHTSFTETETTDRGNGWESERESTRGEGGGRREYGESWSTERDFDENVGSRAKDVLDQVQSEPFVESRAETEVSAAVLRGEAGDESLGASGELLSAEAGADAAAGIDATRGAYAEANAHAGAYLGKGEAHFATDSGTAGEVSAYLGGEANAEAQAQIGPGGASISAGADAFVGGKAEAGINQDIGDYGSVGVGGSVSYGIGAEANVDAEASWDRIGFSGEVGLTLGLGASLDFDVSISPKEIIGSLNPFD